MVSRWTATVLGGRDLAVLGFESALCGLVVLRLLDTTMDGFESERSWRVEEGTGNGVVLR